MTAQTGPVKTRWYTWKIPLKLKIEENKGKCRTPWQNANIFHQHQSQRAWMGNDWCCLIAVSYTLESGYTAASNDTEHSHVYTQHGFPVEIAHQKTQAPVIRSGLKWFIKANMVKWHTQCQSGPVLYMWIVDILPIYENKKRPHNF